jgi:hypothetical protein
VPDECLTDALTVLDANSDLKRIVEAWPDLPEHIRAAG